MPVHPRPCRTRRLALGAALLLAAAGCDDPTRTSGAGGTVEGTYVLRSIDGAPLPAVVDAGGPSLTVLADTLRIQADGWATEIRVQRVGIPGSSLGPRLETVPLALAYRRRWYGLELVYACPPTALCVVSAMAWMPARLTRGALVLDHTLGSFRFQRVD